jgi:CRP-like cAMP-binding protein
MSNKSAIHELIRGLVLFEGIAKECRDKLVAASRELPVVRQELIYRRGDESTGLFVLATGHVKLSIPSEKGPEKVIELIGPGQSFGEAAMVLCRPYQHNAQALEEGILLWIPKEAAEKAAQKYAGFSRCLIKSLALQCENLQHDIEVVNLHSASERVADYLLHQPIEGGKTKLMFDKRVIASKLGLKPETFSRALQQLKLQGLIAVKGASILILDPGRLRSVA